MDRQDQQQKTVEVVVGGGGGGGPAEPESMIAKESSQQGQQLRVVVQNLQKQAHLASDLMKELQPDVLLAQEISILTEDAKLFENGAGAMNVSKRLGYGTAITCRQDNDNNQQTSGYRLTNIRRVDSPHAEVGGLIRKKTILATLNFSQAENKNVQFVSFHGYNGQPFKKISYLVDHVQAVLNVLDTHNNVNKEGSGDGKKKQNVGDWNAAIFAGDFNTWSQAHLDAVAVPLNKAGFQLALSWPYPGRDFGLDHVFIRGGIRVKDSSIFQNQSDHQGALLTLSFDEDNDDDVS